MKKKRGKDSHIEGYSVLEKMHFPSHSAPARTANHEFLKHFLTAFVTILLISLFWTEILRKNSIKRIGIAFIPVYLVLMMDDRQQSPSCGQHRVHLALLIYWFPHQCNWETCKCSHPKQQPGVKLLHFLSSTSSSFWGQRTMNK